MKGVRERKKSRPVSRCLVWTSGWLMESEGDGGRRAGLLLALQMRGGDALFDSGLVSWKAPVWAVKEKTLSRQ